MKSEDKKTIFGFGLAGGVLRVVTVPIVEGIISLAGGAAVVASFELIVLCVLLGLVIGFFYVLGRDYLGEKTNQAMSQVDALDTK